MEKPNLHPRPVESTYQRLVKPTVDRGLAMILIVLTSPVVLLSMTLVKLTSRGSMIYAQERLGLNGRPFILYKIRSMYQGSEQKIGPAWSLPGDPRITAVGHILRRTHVDELPQLWNVLRGDLSLVGPRPERATLGRIIERELPLFSARLQVKPGLTGLAQVQQQPDESLQTVRRKLNFDLYYMEQVGFKLDLKILLSTPLYILGVPPRFLAAVFRFPEFQDVAPVRARDVTASSPGLLAAHELVSSMVAES